MAWTLSNHVFGTLVKFAASNAWSRCAPKPLRAQLKVIGVALLGAITLTEMPVADAVQLGSHQWLVLGEGGSVSCGTFIEALAAGAPNLAMTWNGVKYPNQATEYMAWINGYITGVNLAALRPGKEQVNPVDEKAILIWVKNYCTKRPTATLADAAGAFVRAHSSAYPAPEGK